MCSTLRCELTDFCPCKPRSCGNQEAQHLYRKLTEGNRAGMEAGRSRRTSSLPATAAAFWVQANQRRASGDRACLLTLLVGWVPAAAGCLPQVYPSKAPGRGARAPGCAQLDPLLSLAGDALPRKALPLIAACSSQSGVC